MREDTKHKARVKKELKAAGVTKYGMLKLESKHLPAIIHPDEHIEAVAYGLRENYSAMLVATDRRIVYLDKKPFFTISDELTYEMVAGVGYNIQGRFAAVILHTRIGDYPLRFVNLRAAEKFIKYIEMRRVEVLNGSSKIQSPIDGSDEYTVGGEFSNEPLTEDGIKFLRQNNIGTLSTIDRTGNVHGAAVYYFVDAKNNIYVLTKSGTRKAHNIVAHHQVALTVFDTQSQQTLQLQGVAEIEPDPNIRDFIYNELTKSHNKHNSSIMPPVVKLKEGMFMVIRVRPTAGSFREYQKE